jgi:hypothetical protein
MAIRLAQRLSSLFSSFLTVTDTKSFVIFILFFLALYFIGHGLLDIVKCLWLWIVVAMALWNLV